MISQNKRLFVMAFVIVLLLLIPLIAMQFTPKVNWSPMDFAIMGTILLGIGLTYELVARRSEKPSYRFAFGVGLAGAFLLFWANGAVGIIGDEGQSANLLFGAVFVVGFIGALIARFKPGGMARTLFVAAIVQMLVPVFALIIWPPSAISWAPGVIGVFILTAFFALLFAVSGFLFRRVSLSS